MDQNTPIPELVFSRLGDTSSQARMKRNLVALKAHWAQQQELFHQEESRKNAIFELQEATRLKKSKEPPTEEPLTQPKSKIYGFTLTLPPSKWGTFASEMDILNRSLDKIQHLKAYKTRNFFACHEKQANGHLHSHAILEVDLSDGLKRYPRTKYWVDAHGCGEKAVMPEGGVLDENGKPIRPWRKDPLSFHRYITDGKTTDKDGNEIIKAKFGFFGTPWMS